MDNFDIAIIGGGPAGYVGALKGAALGKNIIIFTGGDLGGTCLNRGCIPTKSLVHTGTIYKELQKAKNIGISTGDVAIDFDMAHAHKQKIVDNLKKGIGTLLDKKGVTVVEEKAFINKNKTITAGSETYSARSIIIATGSAPAVPPIEGADGPDCVTSNELLENAILPKTMVIVGGGVIGIEFAFLYSAIGVSVTVIEIENRILPFMTADISSTVATNLKKAKVKIIKGAVQCITHSDEGSTVTVKTEKGEKTFEAEKILISTGRKPVSENIFDLGLGIKTNRGFIEVDKNYMTTAEGIYAVGDVIGGIMLAHLASAEAITAVENICKTKNSTNMSSVPSCVYTMPEVAIVGLTEDEAIVQNIPVKTGVYQTLRNGKSMIDGQDRGFIKIISDEKSGKVLGCEMVSGRATDMVATVSTAITAELTVHELASIIMPHPSYSEMISEATEDTNDSALHIVY